MSRPSLAQQAATWAKMARMWAESNFVDAVEAFRLHSTAPNFDTLNVAMLALQTARQLSDTDLAIVMQDGHLPMMEVVPRLSDRKYIKEITHRDDEEFK